MLPRKGTKGTKGTKEKGIAEPIEPRIDANRRESRSVIRVYLR